MMDVIISQNIIELICECLKLEDPKYIAVALEALANILTFGKTYYIENGVNLVLKKIEELGVTDLLESLQYHPVEIVYEKTLKLLEAFFETENNY
jgi:hypothetical protein